MNLAVSKLFAYHCCFHCWYIALYILSFAIFAKHAYMRDNMQTQQQQRENKTRNILCYICETLNAIRLKMFHISIEEWKKILKEK